MSENDDKLGRLVGLFEKQQQLRSVLETDIKQCQVLNKHKDL